MTMDSGKTLEQLIQEDLERQSQGGGSGPAVSGTPKPEQRTEREAVIRGLTNTQLQVALRMGIVSEEEVSRVFGPAKVSSLAIDPWGAAENNLMAQWQSSPPPIPAAPVAPPPPPEFGFQPTEAAQITGSTGSASATGTVGIPTEAAQGVTSSGSASATPSGTSMSAAEAAVQGGGAAGGTTGSSGGGSGRASVSGGGSGGASSTAPVKHPPLPNSLQDLRNRGALGSNTRPFLEGQQYARPNETVQATDGQWYNVDPQGNPVGGPFPSQTAAGQANVFQQMGPAVTSNQYANIGTAALQGAARPRVAPGSGMNASVSLDQIIDASMRSGDQRGDFIGSAQQWQTGLSNPTDIALGGVPDYGGMRPVLDAAGNIQSYTGRTLNDAGQEIAIGVGSGTQQSLLDSGLPASIVSKLDGNAAAQAQMVIDQMRQAGTMPDLAALQSQSRYYNSQSASPYATELAKVRQALGMDPYELDLMPDTFAGGGGMTVREPSVIQGLQTGTNYGVLGAQPERVEIEPLGTPAQQQQAQGVESMIAQALGGRPMARGEQMRMTRGEPAMGRSPVAQGMRSTGIGRNRFAPAPVAPAPAPALAPAPVTPRPALPNPWANIGVTLQGGNLYSNMGGTKEKLDAEGNVLVPGTPGKLFAMPRYDEAGNFLGWARMRQPQIDLRAFIDENPRNGRDDRLEDGDPATNPPQSPANSPIPNIFATGGSMTMQPQPVSTPFPAGGGMGGSRPKPFTNPAILEALAKGVNKRARLMLPQGMI